MANVALSPARLAEIVAHIDFYDADAAEEVVVALGYEVTALEDVESGRARLRWALEAGRRQGGIEELREFVTAYDVVHRRLRARRPRLSHVARDPRLEPPRTAATPRPADAATPLPKEAATAAPQAAKPSYLVQPHLHVQVDRPQPVAAAYPAAPAPAAPTASPPPAAAAAPEAQAVPNFTIMQSSSIVNESEALPFASAPAPKDIVRPASPRLEHVSTGTSAPSSESPLSLPFVARSAAKEETKLRPEQIDLSLFPLELYAEISGGLARGDDRAKLLASRGLTDSLFDVLAQAWAKKLASDPNLMARFKELARQTASGGRRTP